MIKVGLFFKHLKRFVPYLFRDLKRILKENFTLQRMWYAFLEPIAITLIAGIVFSVIGALVLTATILSHKWLHFREDFTFQNFTVSMGIAFVVAAMGGFTSALVWHAIRTVFRFFRNAWRETSTRAIARNLWE